MRHLKKHADGIFAEPPVDILYQRCIPRQTGNARVFSVEFLPGQFDQRADSAVQCVQFIKEDEKPVITYSDNLCDRWSRGRDHLRKSSRQ